MQSFSSSDSPKMSTETRPIVIRIGHAHNQLTHIEFGLRYRASFADPAFEINLLQSQ